jgi:uncharacterized protein YeeX (DUF496 family)
MELPKVYLKLFEGKVKDVLKEMKSCYEHMMDHYPFEECKNKNVPIEIRKLKEKHAKMHEELKIASSKEN